MGSWFDVRSADGTRIRGWSNDGEGVPLVISNGLGSVPQAWPRLLAPDCGYRAVTWAHRGTFGSERPADLRRIEVADHADDLVAVMDAAGMERAVVVGWSLGVNVACVAAQDQPERVAGLLSVAGVPGGTFRTMGAPLRVPSRVRMPLSVSLAHRLRDAGPALTKLTSRMPVNRTTAWLLTHSGFMLPAARTDLVLPMLREFVRQDWQWYGTLAVAAVEHQPMDISNLHCPTSWLAGERDVLTSAEDVRVVAAAVPDAEFALLPGSHFLPMEYPDEVHQALQRLTERCWPSA